MDAAIVLAFFVGIPVGLMALGWELGFKIYFGILILTFLMAVLSGGRGHRNIHDSGEGL